MAVALFTAVTFAFAGAAQAVIVQYTSTTFAGLGDPGDLNPAPGTLMHTANSAYTTAQGAVLPGVTPNGNFVFRPDLAANGLPACNKGLTPHSNAEVPAAGFANVVSINDYPGVKFTVEPYKMGAATATGSWTNPTAMKNSTWMGNLNVFGGARNANNLNAGVNGAVSLTSMTCSVFFTTNILLGAPNLNGRTHMTSLQWPHKPSTVGQRPLTFDLTVGKGLNFGYTANGGGYSAVISDPLAPDPLITQYNLYVKATEGPNQFGGGVRGTGGGNIHLTAVKAPGVTLAGGWASGPRIGGHGGQGTKVNQLVTQVGVFTVVGVGATVPVTLRVWNFPWTSGFVSVQDDNRTAVPPGFQSFRQSAGFDNRNAEGTTGNLQLITPFIGTLQNLALYFSGNQRSLITFAPEPAATAMLGVGVFALLGLHTWQRRR